MDSLRAWLLEGDPSIRWQVMRNLLGSPNSEWAAERAKVELVGWGARLLSHQDDDGQWAGGAYNPAIRDPERAGQPWTATTHSLSQLRTFGLDPASVSARRTVELLGEHARWEEGVSRIGMRGRTVGQSRLLVAGEQDPGNREVSVRTEREKGGLRYQCALLKESACFREDLGVIR